MASGSSGRGAPWQPVRQDWRHCPCPTAAHLRVDAQSRVALVGERHVELLAGAVYFDSGRAGPAGSAEVIIETPLARLRNVGTRYEARLVGDRLEVGVREGDVVIAPFGDSELVVSEGELLVLGAGGSVERVVLSAADERWDWTLHLTPPFPVEGRTLGEFFEWIERESGLRVRLATDAAVLDIVLHGDLVWTEPRAAIGPTLRLCGLDAVVSGETVLVEDLRSEL